MAAGQLVLFGGPAGAGKSTLAAAWCATRKRAVHIELDAIRALIVSGLVDPQDTTSPLQHQQYEISVRASCALALSFLAGGYDVALDDVLEPDVFARLWQPSFAGIDYSMVIVIPTLEETLRRSTARQKDVRPELTCQQHEASLRWPDAVRLDTTGLTPAESLALARARRLLP